MKNIKISEFAELGYLYAHWKQWGDKSLFAFCKGHKINPNDVPEIIYSERQRQFIADVLKNNLNVLYTYNPYGNRFCPAVIVDKCSDLQTDTLPVSENFGLRYFLYAPT